ncbi:hypothetical protein [Sulfitobacter aestuariivivens]|uniref:Uncharacterized protein n=1 Tax=Sulfitobacter aestuariivivens TaxID=2766981 RepID=A0A927HG52_9RHOB|nr:hypothetical protein [Sulfitobacter aestuariivivens]MBD3665109.1 hypothetical protein [Sulfitobacter aestuariivivens]
MTVELLIGSLAVLLLGAVIILMLSGDRRISYQSQSWDKHDRSPNNRETHRKD